MSLTKVSYSMINGASVNVRDFGAIGDGIADDTIAIQAAIDFVIAQGYGGEIWFPQGQYRVTDTIEMIGDYTAPNQPRGIRLVGAMGTQNMNPSTANAKDVSSNVYIFGDGIPITKPVFYCWGGNNNTFEHLCIFGARAAESATQAYACVWVDFNHENYRFYDCKFGLAPIGIRVCSSYNYATAAWTPGVSAYDGTTFIPNTLVGGFASDNGSYINCTFGYHSIAGLSIESAQALDMYSQKCIFGWSKYGVSIPSCQGLTLQTPTFLAIDDCGIALQAIASTGNIIVNNSHIEGANVILFEALGLTSLGKGITFNSCGGGDINIRGTGGTVTINNSILRTVSMKSANVSLIINNTTMQELDKTASLGNGPFLKLSGVNVVANFSPNWTAYETVLVEKSSFPTYTAFGTVGTRVSGLNLAPALMLGTVLSGSTVQGMEGVSFSAGANSLFIGWGCYQNSVGTIIATNTSGGYITFNSTGSSLKVFTGQILGATPAVTTGSYT